MVAKSVDIHPGDVFGRLTVMSEERSGRYVYVHTVCSCGTHRRVERNNLRKGATTSCGCFRKEHATGVNFRHGRRGSPVYAVWAAMVQRCTNPRNAQAVDYCLRGITVDPTWKRFEGFYADMGDPPFEGATLERLDNDKGYSKSNCCWASRADQAKNKRNSVKLLVCGKEYSLLDIAEIHGLSYGCVYQRMHTYGWTPEQLLAGYR